MEGNKDKGSDQEPVPVDYVTEDSDKTKKPEESSHMEGGKSQIEIMVKTMVCQHEKEIGRLGVIHQKEVDRYVSKIEKVKGKYKEEIGKLKDENQELRVRIEADKEKGKRTIEESGCQTEGQSQIDQESQVEEMPEIMKAISETQTKCQIGVEMATPQIDNQSQFSKLEEALKEAKDKQESAEKESTQLKTQLSDLRSKFSKLESDTKMLSLPIIASKKSLKICQTAGNTFTQQAGSIRQLVIDALRNSSKFRYDCA